MSGQYTRNSQLPAAAASVCFPGCPTPPRPEKAAMMRCMRAHSFILAYLHFEDTVQYLQTYVNMHVLWLSPYGNSRFVKSLASLLLGSSSVSNNCVAQLPQKPADIIAILTGSQSKNESLISIPAGLAGV